MPPPVIFPDAPDLRFFRLLLGANDSSAGSQIIIHSLNLHGRKLFQLHRTNGRDDMMLDDVPVSFRGVVTNVGFAVGFKPQPAPLRHSIVLVVVHRDTPVVPDGPVQLLLALSPCFGGYAFLNGAASAGVDALGVSALPAAVGLFPDAALAVGSFLCHRLSLLTTRYAPRFARLLACIAPAGAYGNTNKYHRIFEIATKIFPSFWLPVRRSTP